MVVKWFFDSCGSLRGRCKVQGLLRFCLGFELMNYSRRVKRMRVSIGEGNIDLR
jgi:hypothetical protein